jgi:hypothetical protein
MTQPERLLAILKDHSQSGISAEEIQRIAWIPQYNSRIKDLRDQGHRIESRRCPDGRSRFFIVEEPQQILITWR